MSWKTLDSWHNLGLVHGCALFARLRGFLGVQSLHARIVEGLWMLGFVGLARGVLIGFSIVWCRGAVGRLRLAAWGFLNCGCFLFFMKSLKKVLLLAGVTAALGLGNVQAQGPDMEQMRQRMMERVRENLGVTDDAEWKIISERAEKVMAAQREARSGAGMGMMFGRGGAGGGGERRRDGDAGGQGGGERRDRGDRGGGRGGAGMFGGEPSQETKDLQAAIEAKAPADEIKAKLEKFRAAKKAKEANLVKAQEQLKEVLNARQEAAAVLAGLLN